ncbi:MAG TPA: AI-2E family transporter [Mesorhizobium sp.]|nr:AI-2E family transporter [Mesorhizobium sp.]
MSVRQFDEWHYVRRVAITLALVGLAYMIWRLSGVALLLFAAVLLAVVLRALADLIARHTPVPAQWTLTLTILVLSAFVVGFLILFGAQVSAQFALSMERLPAAIDAAGDRLGIDDLRAEMERSLEPGQVRSFIAQAASFGYTFIGAAADLLLVIVAAVYLAADPKLYRRGTAKLLPPNQHARIFDAMDATGAALRLWFWGQLATMAVVGIASGLAYWWIGLPSPLVLAIIAALTNFVPFIGPIAGAVPALIFALAIDQETVLWTAGAVLIIQQIEGNVLTPFIQRRAVMMPPVVILFAIVVFGFLFGILGVLLAVPLAVAITVLVKKLWVRQTLGEETEVPGEAAQSVPT